MPWKGRYDIVHSALRTCSRGEQPIHDGAATVFHDENIIRIQHFYVTIHERGCLEREREESRAESLVNEQV